MNPMIRQLEATDVPRVIEWRYPPPYDVYDFKGALATVTEHLTRPETGAHVMEEDKEVIALFTIGQDARIPGGDYSLPAVDIGLAVRPDLTGAGNGHRFVAQVVDFVAAGHEGEMLRVTIARANRRAIRVWEGAGFGLTDEFELDEPILGSRQFVVLTSG